MNVGHEPTVEVQGRIGETLADRYLVRECLGAGGMGVVFRVLDRDLDEEMALKMLPFERALSPEATARFRREVKLARKVTHPNVARTYDLGRHGDLHFLTMELAPRQSLPSECSPRSRSQKQSASRPRSLAASRRRTPRGSSTAT
ncbi:MAG: hypothetical protein FJ095_00915 [Deltaproteobacteria bacterium]|nr:hypothetical protein [Deltaproteobacteria bacterium]